MRNFMLDPAAELQGQVRTLLEKECAAARRRLWTTDAVHAVRQNGKRSRALLRLVRPGLQKKHFKPLNRAWRDIGRLLAPARDRTVINDCLTGLRKRYPEQVSNTTLALLRGHLPRISRSQMQATLRQVEVALDALGPRFSRLVCAGGWPTAITGHAQALDACRTGQRRVAEHNNAARRHEWRKRIKDVRYQTHVLRRFSPGTLVHLEKAWDRLGALLGEENDLVMTRRWIAGLPTVTRSAAVGDAAQQWLRHLRRRTDLAAECLPTTPDLIALLTHAHAGQD